MTIEYTVIIVYLLLLLAIGAVVKRFNKDDSDYFRSGCKGTWWLVGASAFMVQFSAWTFTGAAGAAYEAGWSVMTIFIANAMGYFLVAALFGPWFRQMRVVTIPEAIRARFNPATQQFYAWLTVLLGLLYAGVWLSGLATFCHAVFGWDLELIIIGIGVIVLFYSTVGGSWGVMSTDFLQTLILIPITILVAFLCLRELGGIDGLMTGIKDAGLEEKYSLINEPGIFKEGNTYTFVWAAAVFVAQVIKINTVQASQRYYAVKTGNDARKAAMLAGVLMLLGSLIWFIPPMTGRLLFEADILALKEHLPKYAEASYAVVSIKLLPVGLVGLMVVAMLSATMSSLDSGLNKNAAMFVRDIYPAALRFFGDKPTPGNPHLRLAQVASLTFGVIIICLALYFSAQDGKGVFEIMLNLGAMLALPLAVPMLLAMLIRKTPSWAALASIGVGLSVSTVGFYSEDWFGSGKWFTEWLIDTPFYHQPLFGGKWAFSTVVFANIIASTIGFFLSVPFWKTSSAEHHAKVDRFFTNMHTPIDFDKEVGQGNDLSQLNIIGAFAVIVGLFVCSLTVLKQPVDPMLSRLGILFVGGFVGVIGLLFIWVARKSKADTPSAPPRSHDGA